MEGHDGGGLIGEALLDEGLTEGLHVASVLDDVFDGDGVNMEGEEHEPLADGPPGVVDMLHKRVEEPIHYEEGLGPQEAVISYFV